MVLYLPTRRRMLKHEIINKNLENLTHSRRCNVNSNEREIHSYRYYVRTNFAGACPSRN